MVFFRFSIMAAALAAGCAAPGQPGVVFLESDSYCCGAAEGLGCGLALQPVLQQIDALEGVEESSVSWDGRTFRIDVEPGADATRLAIEAGALMEGDATCVVPARGKAEAAPGRWFNAEETVELSRYEAGVIAADLAAAASAEVALEPGVVERLRAVLQEEVQRAFEAAHAAGGGVYRLHEQIPAARPRVEARLGEILTPEQLEQVLAVLDRELAKQ